jgi:DNA topoisomerase-1
LEARVTGADEVEAVDAAAAALGNTRTVARSSYVHPRVLEAGADELRSAWSASRGSAVRSRGEAALARLLQSAGSTAATRTSG